jgi:hypothetical protein
MGVILKKKTGWRPEAFNGVIERWSDGVLEVMGATSLRSSTETQKTRLAGSRFYTKSIM